MFDIEQSVVFALSKASQRVSAVFKEEFKDYGITPGQFILLAILWKTDGLSQHELAKRTRIDRTTLGGITDRLEGAGFLVRRTFAEDHRAYQVWVTEQGRYLEGDLSLATYRVRQRILEQMAPFEYKQLKLLPNKLFYRYASCHLNAGHLCQRPALIIICAREPRRSSITAANFLSRRYSHNPRKIRA